MKTGIRAHMKHIFNPLHIYCRLMDRGVSSSVAKKIALIYEFCLFKPITFSLPAIKHQKREK